MVSLGLEDKVVLVTGAANAEVARGRARANADFMMATKSNDQNPEGEDINRRSSKHVQTNKNSWQAM